MVARDGCLASIHDAKGSSDELDVRCPREERLGAWFAAVDKMVAGVATEKVAKEERGEDIEIPSAEVVTAKGVILRLTQPGDVARLTGEVRALTAELAAAEVPNPGPSSPRGWQLMRVAGPASVVFAGTPARGVLDARISTTGQYFCEFKTDAARRPMRATKSGWITPKVAAHAIDEVLSPLRSGNGENGRSTYAVGVKAGGESRGDAASTAQIFERFSAIQDALGDACLPELEAPHATTTL